MKTAFVLAGLAGLTFAGSAMGQIVNGGFETGSLPPDWVSYGIQPAPSISNAQAHSGTQSAFLGQLGSFPSPEALGDSAIYQAITVPLGGATLDFWYRPNASDSIVFDWQDAYVLDSGGVNLATIFHQESNSQVWTNQTFDLTPYAGTSVRIAFLVHQDGFGDPSGMYVDDVTVRPIPVPGAAALLGLGGLLAARRRRA